MLEKNHKTLKNAIQQLPVHQPEEELWWRVEEGLEAWELDQRMREVIPELPSYQAPDQIWDRIDEALEQDGRVVRQPKLVLLRWASAAASVIILMVAAWWFLPNQNTSQLVFSVEQVAEFPSMSAQDDADDELAFTMIQQLCQDGLIICQEFEFRSLQSELKEITEARDLLKEAMGAYSTDKNLIAQLTQLELERSELLKKMIARI